MQNINFRRWLKHLVKEYQRSGNNCFDTIQNKLMARGVLITNMHILYAVLEDKDDVLCKRLSRLASRLGSVAHRKNSVVALDELREALIKKQDPRDVPFHRLVKVVTTQHTVSYAICPAYVRVKELHHNFHKFRVLKTFDKLNCKDSFSKRSITVEAMEADTFVTEIASN